VRALDVTRQEEYHGAQEPSQSYGQHVRKWQSMLVGTTPNQYEMETISNERNSCNMS